MVQKWYVSRQCYWGVEESNQNVVEIAGGGCDYANPDMLVTKYPGEGQEYNNPIEAVTAAIEICKLWKKDCPKLKITIAHGCTGGNTMPFEASSIKELKAWAKKTNESLPKCAHCGGLIEGEGYVLIDGDPDMVYCREYCAEEAEKEYADLFEK